MNFQLNNFQIKNKEEQELNKISIKGDLTDSGNNRNNQFNNLEQSILSTIVYYDCLDYPLTAVEIFRCLVKLFILSRHPEGASPKDPVEIQQKPESTGFFAPWAQNDAKKIPLNPPLIKGEMGDFQLLNIIETLEKSKTLKKIIEQKNGFYFLAGREKIVQMRIQRKKLADKKWRKIKWVLRLCLVVPYMRAIFVSGSLAQGNVKSQSDIDILVVAKYGRIWTCRTFLTILLSLLGKYRQAKSTADKVCPNHYITDKALTIPFPSLYNAQTYVHFFALDPDSNKYLEKFKKANSWIGNYLYCFDSNESRNSHTLKLSLQIYFLLFIRRITELFSDNKFGDWLENKFRTFETNRIKKNDLYQKSGGRITLSDEQLEFHPDSPEKIIVEKFNRKMTELGFKKLANLKDSGLK